MRANIHHFVVSSVLAHAAVFAAWTGTASRSLVVPASQSSAPYLQVALQTDTPVVHVEHIRHIPRQQKIRHTHRASAHPQVTHTRQATTPLSVTHHSNPPVNAAHAAYLATLQRKAIRNRVLSRIRTDLQQYFVYPLLAQRRGWQGRVVLAFSLEANGSIRNIRVASGSGYPILDTSAMSALSHVRQLFPDGTQLGEKSMQLQLPVIFELQGG